MTGENGMQDTRGEEWPLVAAETLLKMQQARRQSTQVQRQAGWQMRTGAMMECLAISLSLLHQVLKAQLRPEKERR